MNAVERALALLDSSRRRLLSEIEGLDEAHFGRQPAGGGWTVAQTAEHVARVEEAIARGITAAAAGKLNVKGRPSDVIGRLLWLTGIYRVVRVRAMAALAPEKSLPRAETLALLRRNRENLLSVIQSVPFTGLRLRHPVFGPFRGDEMVRFASLHEERHRLQIVRIKRAIGVR